MTWQQFYAARQLIAEERYGAPLRASQRALAEQVEATKDKIRRFPSTPRAESA